MTIGTSTSLVVFINLLSACMASCFGDPKRMKQRNVWSSVSDISSVVLITCQQTGKMCAHHNTLKYHAFLFTNMQVYSQLNHINACISYPATLRLVEDVSKLHSVPLER